MTRLKGRFVYLRLTLLVLVAILGIAVNLASSIIPDTCPGTFERMQHASGAWKWTWAGSLNPPTTDLTWQYIAHDNSLHTSRPEDVIGFAFQMDHETSVGDAIFATMFILEYEFPPPPCDMTLTWEIHPQVIFPTGYLFVNQGDMFIDVEMFTLEDPTAVINVNNLPIFFATMSGAYQEASQTQDSKRWYNRHLDENDGGPVYVSHKMEGKFSVSSERNSRLFVVASVALRGGDQGRACNGCTVPINSLLEAGIFRGTSPEAGAAEAGYFGPFYYTSD